MIINNFDLTRSIQQFLNEPRVKAEGAGDVGVHLVGDGAGGVALRFETVALTSQPINCGHISGVWSRAL